jgi:hypothetical protein
VQVASAILRKALDSLRSSTDGALKPLKNQCRLSRLGTLDGDLDSNHRREDPAKIKQPKKESDDTSNKAECGITLLL